MLYIRLVGIMLQISITILFKISLKISSLCSILLFLLNQAHAGLRPACAWFLKIDPVRMSVCVLRVCVCVCVRPRGY